MILDSSMVEHSAVNRVVVGSSPTRGAEKPQMHLHLRFSLFPGHIFNMNEYQIYRSCFDMFWINKNAIKNITAIKATKIQPK